jgi:hypothetical protein
VVIDDLQQLFREHDRLMQEASVERKPAPPPQVKRKDFNNALVSVAVTNNEQDWGGWQRWLDGNLTIAQAGLREELENTIVEVIVELRRKWKHEIVALVNENRELKGMLGDLLNKFAGCNDQATKLRSEVVELRQLERDRCVREEVQVERSAYVAEVKKQAAFVHAELEQHRVGALLAERDARIEKLETQVHMLCSFLSVSGLTLPKGL